MKNGPPPKPVRWGWETRSDSSQVECKTARLKKCMKEDAIHVKNNADRVHMNEIVELTEWLADKQHTTFFNMQENIKKQLQQQTVHPYRVNLQV